MSDPLVIIKNLYSELANGNVFKTLGYLDVRVKIYNPGSLPYGGTYDGREGFLKLVSGVYSTWSSIHFMPDYFMVCEELVVVRGEFTGKIAAADGAIHMPFLHIWKIQEGSITEIWYYFWDTAAISNYLRTT